MLVLPFWVVLPVTQENCSYTSRMTLVLLWCSTRKSNTSVQDVQVVHGVRVVQVCPRSCVHVPMCKFPTILKRHLVVVSTLKLAALLVPLCFTLCIILSNLHEEWNLPGNQLTWFRKPSWIMRLGQLKDIFVNGKYHRDIWWIWIFVTYILTDTVPPWRCLAWFL